MNTHSSVAQFHYHTVVTEPSVLLDLHWSQTLWKQWIAAITMDIFSPFLGWNMQFKKKMCFGFPSRFLLQIGSLYCSTEECNDRGVFHGYQAIFYKQSGCHEDSILYFVNVLQDSWSFLKTLICLSTSNLETSFWLFSEWWMTETEFKKGNSNSIRCCFYSNQTEIK